ncbi:MAG: hypothetical protein RL318_519 [Fibrobacterota bacterium]
MNKTAMLLLSILGVTGAVAAPALRCDLSMQKSTEGGICLDPANLNGKTVTVPSNVTRIGKNGLALCAQKSSSNLATDIQYVIDNSNSMTSKVFWVDPKTVGTVTPDTSWFIYNCMAAVKGTKVALRKRHFGGTAGYQSSGWDTLIQVPSTSEKPSLTDNGACLEANDPYSVRASVVQTAIQYQASLDSSAHAGMIQFNTGVTQNAKMRALNGAGYLRLLDSVGLYAGDGGTNWYTSLLEASNNLKASPNSQKAIIMVSDGEPQTDVSKYKTLVATEGFPKVFGIYFGTAASIPEMDYLTQTTGGKYWIVPPDRPDSMETVIRAIVGSVMSVSTPATTKLTNLTNSQTSTAVGITQNADSTFSLALDSVIALGSGKNSLRLVSSWTDESGVARSDTSRFTLDVSGAAATKPALTPVPGDPVFATTCGNASSLQFLDPENGVVPWLAEAMGGFSLQLVPSTTDALVKNSITVKEWRKSDLEKVTTLTKQAGNEYLASAVLSVPRPWANTAGRVDVVDGLDTLQASWCYPRDARDCAEDTIQVQAFSSPWVKWEVESATGPKVALGAKAFLPGTPAATSVTAVYSLRGRVLVKRTMRKGADSLYHDTLKIRQGGTAVGPDSIWISKPTLIDSIVVSVTWTLKDTTLADTARILRPALVLDLQNMGDDSAAIGLSKGAQPNAAGLWPIKFLVGSRTSTVNLDSTIGTAGVVGLLGGSAGPTTTLRALFVDPVYGDSAWDSITVPVPVQSLNFVKNTATGPRGSFDLVATVPWESASKIKVFVVHGEDSSAVWLTRSANGTYLGSVAFVQSRLAGVDSVAIGLPTAAGGSDSIKAVLPSDGVHEVLADQARILRPELSLSIARLGRDSITVVLSAGAQPDLKKQWPVRVLVDEESQAVALGARTQGVSVNALLAKSLKNPSWVVVRFIDPLYGDTVTDSIEVPVPQRSLAFTTNSVSGPRGELKLVGYDPWVSGSKLRVFLEHGGDTLAVDLMRTVAGDFSAVLPFSQARIAGTDTLAFGPPSLLGGTDSVQAFLPGDGVHPSVRDTAFLLRPPFSLTMKVDSSNAQKVHLGLVGATPDFRGKASVTIAKPVESIVSMEGAGKLKWTGQTSFADLPESLDSVTVTGFHVDPLYGDTAWGVLRIAAPWFPGSLVASPDNLDPRNKDSLEIVVKDRDADTGSIGSVQVSNGVVSWTLVETGKSTGKYAIRLSARDLDSSWAHRAPRKPWKVILKYQDPLHEMDVAFDTVTFAFTVPLPLVTVRSPFAKVPEGPAPAGTLERSNGSQGLAMQALEDTVIHAGELVPQSIAVRLWETANVGIYVYDQIGVSVNSWHGEVVPKDADGGSLTLIRWDGRDPSGRPAVAGVYVVRVVVYKPDGGLISNDIVRIGLK